mmetsp:Transcript_27504/g.30634  ORF Transcript_27504/g.30634 Transcript_27504/m.30634 type:complete len:313 (-) Transcript_27504:98-1036(-)
MLTYPDGSFKSFWKPHEWKEFPDGAVYFIRIGSSSVRMGSSNNTTTLQNRFKGYFKDIGPEVKIIKLFHVPPFFSNVPSYTYPSIASGFEHVEKLIFLYLSKYHHGGHNGYSFLKADICIKQIEAVCQKIISLAKKGIVWPGDHDMPDVELYYKYVKNRSRTQKLPKARLEQKKEQELDEVDNKLYLAKEKLKSLHIGNSLAFDPRLKSVLSTNGCLEFLWGGIVLFASIITLDATKVFQGSAGIILGVVVYASSETNRHRQKAITKWLAVSNVVNMGIYLFQNNLFAKDLTYVGAVLHTFLGLMNMYYGWS